METPEIYALHVLAVARTDFCLEQTRGGGEEARYDVAVRCNDVNYSHSSRLMKHCTLRLLLSILIRPTSSCGTFFLLRSATVRGENAARWDPSLLR